MEEINERNIEEIETEEYEVSFDEVNAGFPEVLQEGNIRLRKDTFDKWCDKIVVARDKDHPIFRVELYCKNGAIIPSKEVQDEPTPQTIAPAFKQCMDMLDMCIYFLHSERQR